MDVSFIGSGNLAWHLAPALDNVGYIVKEVYSQNPRHATSLVGRLYQADVKATLDFSTSSSEIFIIAVSDDAIQEVAQEIILPEDAILVHTSGGQPLSTLGYAATPHVGVFYPLQTFSKAKKVDFRDVPIFLESDSDDVVKVLMKMGKALSSKVKRITSRDRKALHVAAVFASNFSNHMLSIAQEIAKKNGLDFELLKPLIAETLNKSLSINPKDAQTGPAKRGDVETLDKHLEFLQDEPELAEIYKIVSQHILDQEED
jgi:predicted short-subunit dehydrogenase-like oxidoreductase (DUF2520 family)